MSERAAPRVDPSSVIRSKRFRGLLVLAAVIGVLVSLVSWCFLEFVHVAQQWVYETLPSGLGFNTVPWWWPLPVLALAGLISAFAILRLPGHGGHIPWKGLQASGPPQPIELPGILLAALATLCLGLVLGPEAPLIALGSGLAVLSIRLIKKDAPDQVSSVLAAAGSFAAISTLFGNPVIGALIIIEAAGLGGPTLPLVLLPGLVAAGIGSLVFIGMGSWTGLSTSAYSLGSLSLPPFSRPNLADFGWTILLAIAAAVVTFAIIEIARRSVGVVAKRPFLLMAAAGVVVALLAIAFHQSTGQPTDTVLFSGQDAMNSLVSLAPTLSLATFALLILFKGLAWSVSLGNFRGGPTFPAIFLGVVGGLLASHLPGFSETPAVAVLIGAMCASMLKLPLSSVVLAMLLTAKGGLATTPLIVVAVAVAYITTVWLSGRRPATPGSKPEAGPEAATARADGASHGSRDQQQSSGQRD